MDGIKINKIDSKYFSTNKQNENQKSRDSEKKYECGFCHKKYMTLKERMDCEKSCYAKILANEQQRKEEEKRNKEIGKHRLEKADSEKIQEEYGYLINHISKHFDDFGKPVQLGKTKHYADGILDNPYLSFLLSI